LQKKVEYLEIEKDISGQRLDNFLITYLKGVPRSRIYSMIRKGEIRVDGSRKKAFYKISQGDKIRIPPIRVSNKKESFIPGRIIELIKNSIIHETQDYLAIDKPHGIASHGGSGVSIGIIEAIRNFGKDYRNSKLIHRLDKDTSGCQIIAKNNKFLRECNKYLRERKVKKTYRAIVFGKWKEDGTYKTNVLKKQNKGDEYLFREDIKGKEAISSFKALKITRNLSLIECQLITGRTHQLRVQLSSLGFPIIGDKKYGNYSQGSFRFPVKRMFLHSSKIHIKDLNLSIKSKESEEFKKMMKNDE
tara:strand:+ start:1999 stop:2907 length:909 start_codon:yes stop_codon:yes gene_type:complete